MDDKLFYFILFLILILAAGALVWYVPHLQEQRYIEGFNQGGSIVINQIKATQTIPVVVENQTVRWIPMSAICEEYFRKPS